MLKLNLVEKEKYDEFVKSHPTKSHFLQSLAWGEFSKAKKNLTPHYLGLVNENDEIVAAIIRKKTSNESLLFLCPKRLCIRL